VRDPEKHAKFWTQNFELREMFRSDDSIALTNDAMIIAFFKDTPHPDTIDYALRPLSCGMNSIFARMRDERPTHDTSTKARPNHAFGPTSRRRMACCSGTFALQMPAFGQIATVE
jgi:hypothetical protein